MDGFTDVLIERLTAFIAGQDNPIGLAVIALSAIIEYLVPPFPGDTITLFAAVLITAYNWSFIGVFGAVMTGSVTGSMLAFYVGGWLRKRRERAHGAKLAAASSQADSQASSPASSAADSASDSQANSASDSQANSAPDDLASSQPSSAPDSASDGQANSAPDSASDSQPSSAPDNLASSPPDGPKARSALRRHHAPLPPPEPLEKRAVLDGLVKRFRRHGAAYLIINRFLPGIRALFFVAAGMADMRARDVLLYSTLSAAVWNLAIIAIGSAVGANFETLLAWVKHYTTAVWIVIGVLVAVWMLRLIHQWREG